MVVSLVMLLAILTQTHFAFALPEMNSDFPHAENMSKQKLAINNCFMFSLPGIKNSVRRMAAEVIEPHVKCLKSYSAERLRRSVTNLKQIYVNMSVPKNHWYSFAAGAVN